MAVSSHPEQLKGTPEDVPLRGLKPSRGVIEVKAALHRTCRHRGNQTNTRLPQALWPASSYQLPRLPIVVARSVPETSTKENASCWPAVIPPSGNSRLSRRKAAEIHGERLADYLQRMMLYAAPLDNPRDLAFFLASYAREARHRVEQAPLNALESLRTSLETALGMKVETERGLHFFRSTLVQTLFYGVFSAWVIWHRERPGRYRHVQLENGRLQPSPAYPAQAFP